MNKEQSRLFVAELLQDLENGNIFPDDFSRVDRNRLIAILNAEGQRSKSESVEDVLDRMVMPWLVGMNGLMQLLQTIQPAEYYEQIRLSQSNQDMEVCQHWIVPNHRLRLLMRICGCKFVKLDDVSVWCNTSSEVYGSLAIQKLGKMLLAGKYDAYFKEIKCVPKSTNVYPECETAMNYLESVKVELLRTEQAFKEAKARQQWHQDYRAYQHRSDVLFQHCAKVGFKGTEHIESRTYPEDLSMIATSISNLSIAGIGELRVAVSMIEMPTDGLKRFIGSAINVRDGDWCYRVTVACSYDERQASIVSIVYADVDAQSLHDALVLAIVPDKAKA